MSLAMQVAQPGGQICKCDANVTQIGAMAYSGQLCNYCKWRHLVAIQVPPPGGQNWNQCKLHYMLAKFGTNTGGATSLN